MRRNSRTGLLLLAAAALSFPRPAHSEQALRVATFQVDATPPIGSPVAYAPARKILDPLSARGIVLTGAGKPIVLCAVDWIGISNGGHDEWREKLAAAAATSADRVAVHALHQHDGPRCDFTAERLLAERGIGKDAFDGEFARKTIARVEKAIRAALEEAEPVTHLGVGRARVAKVASGRRILGVDGKVQITRWSRTTDPEAIAAPEGLIDPYVRLLSFWDGDRPLACLSYYATHPQSYYGEGDVSADFVGLARARREAMVRGVTHVHFNGAGGNITAGKYNDGSEKMRPILVERLAEGMRKAWENTVKSSLSPSDVEWRVGRVKLPVAAHLVEEDLLATLNDPVAEPGARLAAASNLAWLQRNRAGHEVVLGCLRLGEVYVLHMPGELFVEYQLASQEMKPTATVCMAAYGDYAPGYIGTEISYSQGGYETSPRASRVAPSVERVLLEAMRRLLR